MTAMCRRGSDFSVEAKTRTSNRNKRFLTHFVMTLQRATRGITYRSHSPLGLRTAILRIYGGGYPSMPGDSRQLPNDGGE